MPPRRKRKEKPKLPDTAIDYAALDRRVRLHGAIVEHVPSEEAGRPAAKVSADPLDRLHARGRLDPRQYDAGNQLREDYQASLGPSGGQSFGEPSGSGFRATAAPQQAQIEASERLAQARRAVGRQAWHWLAGVVLDAEPVAAVSAEMRVHRDLGMGQLLMALDMLAGHYRIPGERPLRRDAASR